MHILSIVDCRVESDRVQYLAVVKLDDGDNYQGREIWVDEAKVKNEKLIQRFLRRVTKDREVDVIVGASPTNSGHNWFYVKWAAEFQGAWLPSSLVRTKYPQKLIRFYEEHIFMS